VPSEVFFMTMLAKDVMKYPVVIVKESDPVTVAVDLFLKNLYHGLPVVNEEGMLVGMITTFDLIRHSLGTNK